MKIYLVSDNVDTLVGMRLAGIEGCVVHEQGELKKAIDHALEDKEIGILLLTEKFGREYPELINKVKLDHKLVREFEPEMGRIHVARISGADGDRGKIERVRVCGGDNRDHYGSKLK